MIVIVFLIAIIAAIFHAPATWMDELRCSGNPETGCDLLKQVERFGRGRPLYL
jgi:hypothetical protein